jgi:hypothetical protein
MLAGTFVVPKCPQVKNKRGRSASRPWRVTKDPSGDFLGRNFRSFDLFGARENYWPVGITFKNLRTGEYKIWRMGQFVSHKEAPAHANI